MLQSKVFESFIFWPKKRRTFIWRSSEQSFYSRPSVWHFRCTSSPPLLGFFLFRYTPVVVFSRYFHPGKKPWRINGEKREKWWWINCINVRETRRQKRGFGHSWQANRLFLGCWCCTVGNLRYKNFLSGVHFFASPFVYSNFISSSNAFEVLCTFYSWIVLRERAGEWIQ